MTPTAEAERAVDRKRARRPHSALKLDRGDCESCLGAGRVLCRYVDEAERPREVVAFAGVKGSRLVIDRDASSFGDRRLIAHLAPDEPEKNAEIVCAEYLRAPDARTCRPVLDADITASPVSELEWLAAEPALLVRDERMLSVSAAAAQTTCLAARALTAPGGDRNALELRFTGMRIPELRWWVQREDGKEAAVASLRDVVGRLQRYEPARSMTAHAIMAYRADPAVSVVALGVELERLNASRTVLNRGLRAAVLRKVGIGAASMSEIALRCGRVKSDSRGLMSGETSWLARRIGVASDAPGCPPSPWVHSEVLALIARNGLGVSPREVEVE
ncbi:MAG: hypothetical protein ACYCU0_01280 [Solirubrobacteraceae bacterium]